MLGYKKDVCDLLPLTFSGDICFLIFILKKATLYKEKILCLKCNAIWQTFVCLPSEWLNNELSSIHFSFSIITKDLCERKRHTSAYTFRVCNPGLFL